MSGFKPVLPVVLCLVSASQLSAAPAFPEDAAARHRAVLSHYGRANLADLNRGSPTNLVREPSPASLSLSEKPTVSDPNDATPFVLREQVRNSTHNDGQPLSAGLPDAFETAFPAPCRSFTGIVDDGSAFPANAQGAIGPRHVVECSNSGISVFRSDGSVIVGQVNLQAFWSQLGTDPGQPASRPFGPRIVYDQYASRWFMVAGSNANAQDGTQLSWLLLAASDTPNPEDGWTLFALAVTGVSLHSADYADVPTIGLDPNNIIVTADIFSISSTPLFVHSDVWVLEKTHMMSALEPLILGIDYSRFHNPSGEGSSSMQPCHTFGQTSETAVNYLVYDNWLDTQTRTRRFFRIQRIRGTGAAATLYNRFGDNFFEVSCYNLCVADAPQRGCATPVDTDKTRITKAIWRNERLWVTQTVGAECVAHTFPCTSTNSSKAAIAWYELDPNEMGAFPGGLPEQEGRVSHPSLWMYYPSIAVNAHGAAAIGFSASDGDHYVGGWFTMREPTDSLNTTRTPVEFAAGRAPYLREGPDTRNRLGNYLGNCSATTVDPTDDLTFWTLQTYTESQDEPADPSFCEPSRGRWGTHWSAWNCQVATGDCNGDDTVDLIDLAEFIACMAGPNTGPLTAPCGCVDLDEDGDADLTDFALFMQFATP